MIISKMLKFVFPHTALISILISNKMYFHINTSEVYSLAAQGEESERLKLTEQCQKAMLGMLSIFIVNTFK